MNCDGCQMSSEEAEEVYGADLISSRAGHMLCKECMEVNDPETYAKEFPEGVEV